MHTWCMLLHTTLHSAMHMQTITESSCWIKETINITIRITPRNDDCKSYLKTFENIERVSILSKENET